MKEILIIHTGGTFGMVPQKPAPTLAPDQVQKRITHYVPELEQIARIDFQMVFNLDSANLNPTHWQRLAGVIAENINRYDGFVIIHGTDSMCYTAAALSFMLGNLPRPVILTGSQRPLAEIRTDARMNLINAVELATYAIPEVCIFFGTELLRGNRAVKVSAIDYGAFTSPNYPPLAEVGLEVQLTGRHFHPTGPLQLRTHFSDELVTVSFFPGLRPDYLLPLVTSPVKAVVLEALGLGNVSVQEKSLVPLVEKLVEAGKLVVVTSQARHGWVDLSRYENGRLIQQVGAVGTYDMTAEATIVKLMYLLGGYPADLGRVKELLLTPMAGEITQLR